MCRYLQNPEPQSDNRCLVCGSVEDLWICLICGNVGCGRYTQEHAKQHYMDTHHNYAMALKDNRVWDYAGGIHVYFSFLHVHTYFVKTRIDSRDKCNVQLKFVGEYLHEFSEPRSFIRWYRKLPNNHSAVESAVEVGSCRIFSFRVEGALHLRYDAGSD